MFKGGTLVLKSTESGCDREAAWENFFILYQFSLFILLSFMSLLMVAPATGDASRGTH